MRRTAIVFAYVMAFCVALPVGLWQLARVLDRRLELPPLAHPVGVAVGGLAGAGGLALMAWAVATLWREGGGLPVSALPPPRLARSGPYRHARHPIYLGFNLALLGGGLAAGSTALGLLVAPAFAPLWLVYARLEDRGLRRRFGRRFRRYESHVGLVPRLRFYEATRLALRAGLPTELEGSERVPEAGPAVLVANHACYFDPGYVGIVTRRPVHFLTTAEAYRSSLLGAYVSRLHNVPVRRYRVDPSACREVVRLLEEGELVGLFPEGERSPLGDYQGAREDVAGVVARLGVPVVPVGISGSYDCGPRWAGALRRGKVRVRVGSAIVLSPGTPAAAVDAALRALVDVDPQPVHLEGLPRDRLQRVLWRCPRCFVEAGWSAVALRCAGCGARFLPTPEGWLEGDDGRVRPLAALGRAVREAPEAGRLTVAAFGLRESSTHGPIRPLEPMGRGRLEIDPEAVRFETLRVSLADLRSVSTERADTLQIATRETMWQFRVEGGSAFRLEAALGRWRDVAAPSPARAEPCLR